jgi:DNA-directed RNA polymerase specialized sigma24 family protein
VDEARAAEILGIAVFRVSNVMYRKQTENQVRDPDSYLFWTFGRTLYRILKKEIMLDFIDVVEALRLKELIRSRKALSKTDRKILVRQVMRFMDVRTRRIFVLRVNRYSWKQIGEILGVSANYAEVMYSRGVERTRKRLFATQSYKSKSAVCWRKLECMFPRKPIRLLSREEEKQLLEAGEEVLIEEFSNPDQLGCPGSAVLRLLVLHSRRLGLAERERILDHMTCCSACFREFNTVSRQVWHRRQLVVIGLCATVFLAVGLTWYGLQARWQPPRPKEPIVQKESPPTEPQQPSAPPTELAYQLVSIDLSDRSVARGEDAPPPKAKSQDPQIPRGRLELRIHLPLGTEEGQYEVHIYGKQKQPLVTAKGQVRLQDRKDILTARVDTGELAAGKYTLAIRQIGWSWRTYRLEIK